jgi:hypothetical protein
MILLGLMFALAIGVSIAWTWSVAFDTHGPWNSFFWFFLVIFLFSWGGGSWITPFGPLGWGVAWMPFLVMGVFMALLLTAVTPRSKRSRTRSGDGLAVPAKPKRRPSPATPELDAAVDVFFWLFIVVLVSLALTNSFWHARPI